MAELSAEAVEEMAANCCRRGGLPARCLFVIATCAQVLGRGAGRPISGRRSLRPVPTTSLVSWPLDGLSGGLVFLMTIPPVSRLSADDLSDGLASGRRSLQPDGF